MVNMCRGLRFLARQSSSSGLESGDLEDVLRSQGPMAGPRKCLGHKEGGGEGARKVEIRLTRQPLDVAAELRLKRALIWRVGCRKN